jgi:uncharacterized protein (DUF433 family)
MTTWYHFDTSGSDQAPAHPAALRAPLARAFQSLPARANLPACKFTRITVDPDVMAGVPTVHGLRIPVATVVAMVADGMSAQKIVADLPDLEPEDVPEALRYAADVLREQHDPPGQLG